MYFRVSTAILDIRLYTNMIVLQSAVNEATFEVLYNTLMVTKMQLSLGCISCHIDSSISVVINDVAVT